MTREKAISILERKTTIPNDGETFDEISEAFDMAISYLSAIEDIKSTLKEWDSMRLSEVHTIKDVIDLIDKHIEGVNK